MDYELQARLLAEVHTLNALLAAHFIEEHPEDAEIFQRILSDPSKLNKESV